MQHPTELATLTQPAKSPSGEYSLVVKERQQDGIPTQLFEIYARSQTQSTEADTPVFVSDERYDVRHMTWFLWGPENRVWVYSGDVGTYVWTRQGETWNKQAWRDSGLQAPPYLKQQRPQIFNR